MRVVVTITFRELGLIDGLTFVDPSYFGRFSSKGKENFVEAEFDRDELEDLMECIASDSNHTSGKRQRELDDLYDRLERMIEP